MVEVALEPVTVVAVALLRVVMSAVEVVALQVVETTLSAACPSRQELKRYSRSTP